MRSSSILFILALTASSALAANEKQAYDYINTFAGDTRCNSCHAAMTVFNPTLSGDALHKVAEAYFRM